MVRNQLSLAKYKLKLHQERGIASDLSIFEVAQLMDLIRTYESYNEGVQHNGIFFSFSNN